MPRGTTPAVAYYRMSSDRQETSIPAQAVAVERLAAERGYRIVREYRDEGISGDATEKRLGFRSMMADCGKGEFAVILCWDQDRFGRFDPLEGGYWLKPMRDAGVRLETVAQGAIDLEDFAGRIVWTVQQEAKHAYLRDLARNSVRGSMEKAKRGEWGAGTPPLGYKVGPGRRLVTVDDDAALVRRIFALYDGGLSLRGVTDLLNVEGVATSSARRGQKGAASWSYMTVRGVLTNRTYLGEFRWNARNLGKYARASAGGVVRVGRGDGARAAERDVIVLPGNHPAIIDDDLFDRVQGKLAARKRRSSPRPDRAYPLTGLCRCERCGFPMVHQTGRGEPPIRYVRCGTQNIRGRSMCVPSSVREDKLLPAVLGVVRERLTDPANAGRLRDAIRRRVEDAAAPADLSAVDREIAVLDADIDAAKRRVMEVDPDMLTVAQEHLRGLRDRRSAADDRRRDLAWRADAEPADVEGAVAAAVRSAATLAERFGSADPLTLREALAETVDRIDLRFADEPGVRRGHPFAGGTLRLKADPFRAARGDLLGSDRNVCRNWGADRRVRLYFRPPKPRDRDPSALGGRAGRGACGTSPR